MNDTVTNPPPVERKHAPPLVHVYRGLPPEPGSVALCGWVKRTPAHPARWYRAETCVVCADLRRAA